MQCRVALTVRYNACSPPGRWMCPVMGGPGKGSFSVHMFTMIYMYMGLFLFFHDVHRIFVVVVVLDYLGGWAIIHCSVYLLD